MILSSDEHSAMDISVDSDDDLTQVISSFQMMNSTTSRYTLTTDLDISVTSKTPRKQLLDSHTSYRRALEQDITQLKLQLAEAQERADTLQNDLNCAAKEYRRSEMTLEQVSESFDESRRLADGLATVVTHLQRNAKESASERAALHSKLEEYEKNRKHFYHRSKILRNENKLLKKELLELNREMEGKCMEIQGLKSENEWLKKQQCKSAREKEQSGSCCEGAKDTNEESLSVIGEYSDFYSPFSSIFTPQSKKKNNGNNDY